MMKQTFNPCDECSYSFSKNNQESSMCKICEFKDYINAEKQGLLLRLPCKVGILVYQAYSIGGISGVDEHRLKLEDISEFGETVFLTQAEAEQRLKEMEDK